MRRFTFNCGGAALLVAWPGVQAAARAAVTATTR